MTLSFRFDEYKHEHSQVTFLIRFHIFICANIYATQIRVQRIRIKANLTNKLDEVKEKRRKRERKRIKTNQKNVEQSLRSFRGLRSSS